MRWGRAIAGFVVVMVAQTSTSTSPSPPPPPTPTPTYSNVARADYVGPARCGECHEEKLEAWRGSWHAVMTQGVEGVVAPFAGERVAYGDGVAVFDREGGTPVMRLAGKTFRVTRTIGARALQEYVGVGEDGVELRLPFGWWMARPGWYPQPYFDSWFGEEWHGGKVVFDAMRPDPAPWAGRCAWCHNTYPFELRMGRPGVGSGPEQHVEMVTATASELPVEQLVTVGISCESCHLGGREHAAGGVVRFGPVSPRMRRLEGAPGVEGGRRDARLVNALCAQCHSTPSPRYPDGAAARNSTEALDLARGECATAIKCTDCHDPHVRGAVEVTCTDCHGALADAAAARAHARHDGVSCEDCHMPRLVLGIGEMVRSHRISSPTNPAMLAAAAPNACNLCHLDRSIRWTVDALREGWGVALAPDGWTAYGDLDHDVGTVWLTGRHGEVRLAAAAALARRGDRTALPALIELLDAAVAHDRMWMLMAVERLLGRRLSVDEYDPLAAPAVRALQVRGLKQRAVRWRDD